MATADVPEVSQSNRPDLQNSSRHQVVAAGIRSSISWRRETRAATVRQYRRRATTTSYRHPAVRFPEARSALIVPTLPSAGIAAA